MRRRPLRRLIAVVVLAGAAVFAWTHLVDHDVAVPVTDLRRPADAAGPFTVVRVVDGDTLIVDQAGAEVRVRLLGIDTPESVKPDSPVECFGPEASARAGELLTGRTVWLEADPTQDAVDVYGRTLAYVWLDGSTMTNQVLVAEGYAREYTYDLPGTYRTDLLAAQDAARSASRGLWSAGTCGGRA